MSSWQGYVDVQLVGTGNVSKACIIGHDGSVWASSPGFAPSAEEAAALIAGFNDPTGLLAQGLHVAGVKYMTIKADPRSVYGKKVNNGVVIVKTGQAIVIGQYDEKIQPGSATLTVEKLADYLIENNF
eukprot:TRINITY_DN34408_c0_g1_i1.p1 TRINITY_DN34408_c0_g1~~TRINITY_DN34408_c0_g1_i1.p1  ORF type:complete len:128 (+),score=44.37 TRINITY_DN34408_c0_g1_i1:114-497(+)